MTKFDTVVNFVSNRKVFTRQQFERRFGQYPNTYSTYLNILVSADLVVNPFAGAFARATSKKDLKDLTVTRAKALASRRGWK